MNTLDTTAGAPGILQSRADERRRSCANVTNMHQRKYCITVGQFVDLPGQTGFYQSPCVACTSHNPIHGEASEI